jgi:hypothetical protein
LEVWELYLADFNVRWFIERANTTLERMDSAILNASINVHSLDVTLLLALLKKATKIPPPHLGAPQIPRIQQPLALKVRVEQVLTIS